MEDFLPIVARTLGQDHAGMIMTKSSLARAYILLEKFQEACATLVEWRTVVPVAHPDKIHAELGYAFVLVKEGDSYEAEQFCK